MNVHAYVDDIAIVYTPSMHLKFRYQIIEMENNINNDMKTLLAYAKDLHQPLNPMKTELVNYHRAVQSPRLEIYYDGAQIIQKRSFKYLGFHLDAKLSFRIMLDAQFVKLRKAYSILKFIHQQFPSFLELKLKFFNTYIWPHLYMLPTIYCLLSSTSRDRVAAFYRRCLRLIYCLFQCPTEDLHDHFKLPTIEQRFKKCLLKRLKTIQQYEPILIDTVLQNKQLINKLHNHYRIKANLRNMPTGRPNKRLAAFIDTDNSTFFDHLCEFVSN